MLTKEQIDILVEAAMEADGGCIYCVAPVLAAFVRAFPDVDWSSAVRRCRSVRSAYTKDEYIEAMSRG